ncbi:MAG TPA: GNAT family N-acetyltransferase, partial [Gaiellaceae bacterium]|nr:GNAT family N-acetyltransferase [Gaiellaceae bacterium]
MRLVPADSIDFDLLLRLFNEAYSDYLVPMQLDRAGLEYTIDVCDIDPAASRIALAGDEPAAFAFLAVRGDEGWIGGMGTAPAHRRRGLGEAALTAVIDEAGRRGARSVLLEVIEGNAPAIALYGKLGFERTRDLIVWVHDGEARTTDGLPDVPESEAHAWIAAHRPSAEPWQRADESLARELDQGLTRNGLVCERDGETVAALLWRPRRDGGP